MFQVPRIVKSMYRLGEQVFRNQKYIISNNSNYTLLNYKTTNCILRKVYFCSQVQDNLDTFKIPGIKEDIDIKELVNNDPELAKKLRVLVLETDVMKQDGLKVPDISYMKFQHWKELLNKTSRSQRQRFLEFLWKTERKKENENLKKEQARLERENRPEYVDDGHIRYGLNHNTFLIRIYDTTINNMYNAKLISAAQFGQPLVIDCGYDKQMTNRESNNCAKQIMLAFSENRFHDEPFDLHLCNADRTTNTMLALHRHIATLYEPWFPLNVHSNSYLNVPSLADRNRLVYLTPHCREELQEYDHDAIYIIGGIVDKVNHEPLSLARAKQEKLRMAKLPLDRYLQWGGGSGKSLTVNQMVSILLDVRRTGDWEYALRHVPRRKLYTNLQSSSIQDRTNHVQNRRRQIWHDDDDDELTDARTFDNLKKNSRQKSSSDFIKDLLKN